MISAILTPILIIILFIGLILVFFSLPGTWLILAGVAGYAWLAEFDTPGKDWIVIAAVAAIAVLGEIVEFLSNIMSAKKWDVPNGAIVSSFIGGIVGGITGFPIILVGSIIGVFIGAFLGAFLYAILAKRTPGAALKVALASLFSRIVAISAKVLITIGIGAYVFIKLF